MMMPKGRSSVLTVRARTPRERAMNEMAVAALLHGQLVVRRDGDCLVATTPPLRSGHHAADRKITEAVISA